MSKQPTVKCCARQLNAAFLDFARAEHESREAQDAARRALHWGWSSDLLGRMTRSAYTAKLASTECYRKVQAAMNEFRAAEDRANDRQRALASKKRKEPKGDG